MPLPLYGFLEGDTIGLLIVADDNETIASVTTKLHDAASIRVIPRNDVQFVYHGMILDPALTVSQAGLTALERFDVKEKRHHDVSEDRNIR